MLDLITIVRQFFQEKGYNTHVCQCGCGLAFIRGKPNFYFGDSDEGFWVEVKGVVDFLDPSNPNFFDELEAKIPNSVRWKLEGL